MKKSALFERSVRLITNIPEGKVLSYGEVARLIDAPGCARHISYILSSSSFKYGLPWFRVINSKGMISLPIGGGYFKQKKLLESEGVEFNQEKISLTDYLWRPSKKEVRSLLKGLPRHRPATLDRL